MKFDFKKNKNMLKCNPIESIDDKAIKLIF